MFSGICSLQNMWAIFSIEWPVDQGEFTFQELRVLTEVTQRSCQRMFLPVCW